MPDGTLEEKCQRAHAAIDAEFQVAINGLRAAQILFRDDISVPSSSSSSHSGNALFRSKWPGMREAVRNAIKAKPIDFTMHDILKTFSQYGEVPEIKHFAISAELWRLNHEGKIELTKKGRPNTYRLIEVK